MIKKTFIVAGLALATLLAGCGGTAIQLSPQMLSEAQVLRAAVVSATNTSVEARIGDSLYVLAESLRSQGNEPEAFAKMDLAIIFFRLATVRSELAQSRHQAQELETSLKVARSKLEEYERILSDLKSSKGEK